MTTTTKITKKINLGEAKSLEELLQKGLTIQNTNFAISLIGLLGELRTQSTLLLESKIKELDELNKDKKEDLEAYETKRVAILEKYALKDANGEYLLIKLQNGTQIYDFAKESIAPRDKELFELAAEYKDILDSISKVNKEMSETSFELDITEFKKILNNDVNSITNLSANDIMFVMELRNILN